MDEISVKFDKIKVSIEMPGFGEDVTWKEILHVFLKCLDGIGYVPTSLEDFYEELMDEEK